jgi:hypothetical protein
LISIDNALLLIEVGANLQHGWQSGIPAPRRSEEKSRRVFAAHLLNNRLQMRRFGASKEFVTLTKQMTIGLCEQVMGELANRRQLHCPFQRALHALLE